MQNKNEPNRQYPAVQNTSLFSALTKLQQDLRKIEAKYKTDKDNISQTVAGRHALYLLEAGLTALDKLIPNLNFFSEGKIPSINDKIKLIKTGLALQKYEFVVNTKEASVYNEVLRIAYKLIKKAYDEAIKPAKGNKYKAIPELDREKWETFKDTIKREVLSRKADLTKYTSKIPGKPTEIIWNTLLKAIDSLPLGDNLNQDNNEFKESPIKAIKVHMMGYFASCIFEEKIPEGGIVIAHTLGFEVVQALMDAVVCLPNDIIDVIPFFNENSLLIDISSGLPSVFVKLALGYKFKIELINKDKPHPYIFLVSQIYDEVTIPWPMDLDEFYKEYKEWLIDKFCKQASYFINEPEHEAFISELNDKVAICTTYVNAQKSLLDEKIKKLDNTIYDVSSNKELTVLEKNVALWTSLLDDLSRIQAQIIHQKSVVSVKPLKELIHIDVQYHNKAWANEPLPLQLIGRLANEENAGLIALRTDLISKLDTYLQLVESHIDKLTKKIKDEKEVLEDGLEQWMNHQLQRAENFIPEIRNEIIELNDRLDQQSGWEDSNALRENLKSMALLNDEIKSLGSKYFDLVQNLPNKLSDAQRSKFLEQIAKSDENLEQDLQDLMNKSNALYLNTEQALQVKTLKSKQQKDNVEFELLLGHPNVAKLSAQESALQKEVEKIAGELENNADQCKLLYETIKDNLYLCEESNQHIESEHQLLKTLLAPKTSAIEQLKTLYPNNVMDIGKDPLQFIKSKLPEVERIIANKDMKTNDLIGESIKSRLINDEVLDRLEKLIHIPKLKDDEVTEFFSILVDYFDNPNDIKKSLEKTVLFSKALHFKDEENKAMLSFKQYLTRLHSINIDVKNADTLRSIQATLLKFNDPEVVNEINTLNTSIQNETQKRSTLIDKTKQLQQSKKELETQNEATRELLAVKKSAFAKENSLSCVYLDILKVNTSLSKLQNQALENPQTALTDSLVTEITQLNTEANAVYNQANALDKSDTQATLVALSSALRTKCFKFQSQLLEKEIAHIHKEHVTIENNLNALTFDLNNLDNKEFTNQSLLLSEINLQQNALNEQTDTIKGWSVCLVVNLDENILYSKIKELITSNNKVFLTLLKNQKNARVTKIQAIEDLIQIDINDLPKTQYDVELRERHYNQAKALYEDLKRVLPNETQDALNQHLQNYHKQTDLIHSELSTRARLAQMYIAELNRYKNWRAYRYSEKDYWFLSDKLNRESFIHELNLCLQTYSETGEADLLIQKLHDGQRLFPGLHLQPILLRLELDLEPADYGDVDVDDLSQDNTYQLLYTSIQELKRYGLFLNNEYQDNSGEVVKTLAQKLKRELDQFRALQHEKEPTPAQFHTFYEHFKKRLHSQDDKLSEHRQAWKPIFMNVLIALCTLCSINIAYLTHSKNKHGTFSFFFEKTKRQALVDKVEQAIDGVNLDQGPTLL